jgi:type I restriction enzyme S subunit
MINKYISAKKRQIELLKERKQALINQAVTKGLDPKVPMKDSDIEWLGKIPAHWETKELKYFVKSNLLSLNNNLNQNLEIKYIDISTTGFGCLRLEPESYLFKNAPLRARRIVHTGDTIISTVRTYLKSMLYIDEDLNNFIVSTGFSVLTPATTILPQLLYFVLSADYFLNTVNKYSIGVSYPSIADARLLSLRISLPPSVTEQVEIFKTIKEKTYELDKCIESLNGLTEKIKEYRTRLISDVVTGKVGVQNIKVPEFVVENNDLSNTEQEREGGVADD